MSIPPNPERRFHEIVTDGDVRLDDWFWFRDRDDPAVIEHLKAENAFTDTSLAHLEGLREKLYNEIVGRIIETDLSVPVRHGPWWYYTRSQEGKNYPIHCRCRASQDKNEAPPLGIDGDVQEGSDYGSDEEVILDENQLAAGHEYFEVGNICVSPDHLWLAYVVDTTGDEVFEMHFRHLGFPSSATKDDDSASDFETIKDVSYSIAWASDNLTVFYTRSDETMRPFQLWRHRLGTDPINDVLILEEPDHQFALGAGSTKDDLYIVAVMTSTNSSEVWVIPSQSPESEPKLIAKRRDNVEYHIEHIPVETVLASSANPSRGTGWFIVLTNDGAPDFKVMAFPDEILPGLSDQQTSLELGIETTDDAKRWAELIEHRKGVRIDSVDVFSNFIVLSERSEAQTRLRIVPIAIPLLTALTASPVRKASPDEPSSPDSSSSDGTPSTTPNTTSSDLLAKSWVIENETQPSTTQLGSNPELDTPSIRYQWTSLTSPISVMDLDVETRKSTLRKQQRIRGGYDPAKYLTFRAWATSSNGTAIPISIVHRSDLLMDPTAGPGSKLNTPAPCILYGYGAYEYSIDPTFSSIRLSLLDRGFVFAIAHVRGGGELGRSWYLEGRMLNKPNTFSDYIACAQYLIDSGFTSPEKLVGRGGSAGGLLIGAVANMAPHLFRALVAEVPFVDCLSTMLDSTLPLTVGEWQEWGNPANDSLVYETMKSYSPYDNVRSHNEDGSIRRYPDILATGGLNDPRVGYWEPAKWVAKLRSANPDNRVLLRTELNAGHAGPSGRYDAWKDEAFVLAFILDALGIANDET